MSTIKTQGALTGEFLLSEGEGRISREKIVVTSGDALSAGQLLGALNATGKYVPYDNAADTGAQIASAVLYAALPASTDDRQGVAIVRLAEVAEALITGLDTDARTDLASKFVIVRQ
ncbi:head decoration protein [Caballeronia sp. dw_19]|uniref:head decoration protein n=1 Tax=Caballeronia sp. dw_19 TaxID=2719791 RepID=UPI001BD3E2EA|nr:head decoration protein [Caballeronia sp. dw_19]